MEDPDQRLKQLQGCQSMFNTTPALKKNVPYVDEYIKLVKKQKEIVVRFHTLSQTHTTSCIPVWAFRPTSCLFLWDLTACPPLFPYLFLPYDP